MRKQIHTVRFCNKGTIRNEKIEYDQSLIDGQSVAFDSFMNPIQLNVISKDKPIECLKSLGYTDEELEKIEWKFEINSDTLILEYRQGRLELTDCKLNKNHTYKIDKSKILQNDFLCIIEINGPLWDNLLIKDEDFNNQAKPFLTSEDQYELIVPAILVRLQKHSK